MLWKWYLCHVHLRHRYVWEWQRERQRLECTKNLVQICKLSALCIYAKFINLIFSSSAIPRGEKIYFILNRDKNKIIIITRKTLCNWQPLLFDVNCCSIECIQLLYQRATGILQSTTMTNHTKRTIVPKRKGDSWFRDFLSEPYWRIRPDFFVVVAKITLHGEFSILIIPLSAHWTCEISDTAQTYSRRLMCGSCPMWSAGKRQAVWCKRSKHNGIDSYIRTHICEARYTLIFGIIEINFPL